MVARLCGHKPERCEPHTSPADNTGSDTRWVLKIRAPTNRHDTTASLCKWSLTHLKKDAGKECDVEGIWFLSAIRRTLAAHETIERLGKTETLSVAQITALVEEHRATGQRVHVLRSVGDVHVEDTFPTAKHPGFAEALTWKRNEGSQPKR